MRKKEKVQEILKRLDQEYGTDGVCYLDHENAWQLLIATMLSAQCTDARVNVVVKGLFAKYPDIAALAKADPLDVEAIVRPCGLGKSKAKDICACMKMLHENIDLVMRYRAFYDKFMGVLVLAFCPDEYDSFVKADSRKKEFGKKMTDHLDPCEIKSLNASISHLDDTFRTPEDHQTGIMRKWVLSSRDLFLDNEIDLLVYMNDILNLSIGVDELIEIL